jgi:hypothetical protein
MWMSEVARKVWMRFLAAGSIADQHLSISSLLVRARPQMVGPSDAPISSAIAWTASQSPGEAAGKPASMMSTPRRASWRATSSFSSFVIVQPGACSPSRSVVSKIRT